MIARIVTRYRELERLYLQGTNSELELMLEKALIRLYAEILTHLARAVRFFREKSIGEFAILIFSHVLLGDLEVRVGNPRKRIAANSHNQESTMPRCRDGHQSHDARVYYGLE